MQKDETITFAVPLQWEREPHRLVLQHRRADAEECAKGCLAGAALLLQVSLPKALSIFLRAIRATLTFDAQGATRYSQAQQDQLGLYPTSSRSSAVQLICHIHIKPLMTFAGQVLQPRALDLRMSEKERASAQNYIILHACAFLGALEILTGAAASQTSTWNC